MKILLSVSALGLEHRIQNLRNNIQTMINLVTRDQLEHTKVNQICSEIKVPLWNNTYILYRVFQI